MLFLKPKIIRTRQQWMWLILPMKNSVSSYEDVLCENLLQIENLQMQKS